MILAAGMINKKLILRVGFKLMTIIAVISLGYVFFSGLSYERNTGKEVDVMRLDIANIKPGEVKYFNVGDRKLLILHRSREMLDKIEKREDRLFKESSSSNLAEGMNIRFRSMAETYLVAYAYDPFYGCEVQLSEDVFIPVCVDIKYDLTGRVYTSRRAEENLIVPNYEVQSDRYIDVYMN